MGKIITPQFVNGVTIFGTALALFGIKELFPKESISWWVMLIGSLFFVIISIFAYWSK